MRSLMRFFKSKPREARRWERVPLEMPLRFRPQEQTVWCEGIAVNISSGGILFRADQVLKVHAPIQMSYVLPDILAGKSGVTVDCNGEILRAEKQSAGGGTLIFAAKILDYDA